MNSIFGIISTTLLYSAPLIYAALGGIISENGGVVNIGIEGMMTIGALIGATVGYFSGNPWLAFLCGGLAGMALALLHAIATVNFAADHVVSGIAINLIGPGLALFLSRIFFEGAAMTKSIPFENQLPQVFNGVFTKELIEAYPWMRYMKMVFQQYIVVYIAFALVFVVWYLLYKTKLGLRIRAVGEHPQAAETLGVDAYKIKYICVLASGFLAGLGGASMSLAVVSNYRQTLISGQGFIALAAVIFGGWKPQGAFAACLLFGAAQGLSVTLGNIGIKIDSNLLSMLPYIITLLVLIIFVKGSNAPSADGKPFERDK
ncbi:MULTISPECIES: ABC transporter permease [Peptoniphilus]|uniref:ABC transporter permease n=1 Tax=Peptoniphilus TaxID=162289 RepID=UPI0001DA9CAA|nr:MULTISPECIES: ABC transporter permease [Peptoniphilus]EFI42458.1 branched-chain amino acid ABC transporter, permease protein [Peptoniphilus sp. oral taxon 386 str. F0131]